MNIWAFDTETCGFHGPIVLIQYAIDDGPIELHNVWFSPIQETIELIEEMCNGTVLGFNLVYDWFHICQLYTVLRELKNRVDESSNPIDHIDLYAQCEPLGRDGVCCKPRSALDLMLHARSGPYQSTMDRKDIRIRRVPKPLAYVLCQELDRRIKLPDIYFAKSSDPKKRWYMMPIKSMGKEDPDFSDVVLKFRASSALKALVIDAGIKKADERLLFHDVMPASKPAEVAWAPFAKAIASGPDWWCEKGRAWPALIEEHASHWEYDDFAREYATDDVDDVQKLWAHFGYPEPGDDDSILACSIGAIRWHGLAVDLPQIAKLKEEALKLATSAPKAPHHVRYHLGQVMTEAEQKVFYDDQTKKETTKRVILERIALWKKDGPNGTKLDHPAALRAQECLDARKSATKVVLYNKILQAGRLHPSASVIGSLSSRMSGRTEVADGKKAANINALGIQRDPKIRSCFPLASNGLVLTGGDFSAFEISIADARYNDPDLRSQLLTCSNCGHQCTEDEFQSEICDKCGGIDTRKKFHALFAMDLFEKAYPEILATKGSADDLYDKGKRAVFGGLLYGGDEHTLYKRIGIPLEDAKRSRDKFISRYKGMLEQQKSIYDRFCSMKQPEGLGTKVYWDDPDDYVESMNGWRRYFTLENKICRALFVLAENPPKPWQQLRMTCVRRDREQKVAGAVRSALFGAAFQIQAANMRSALNHEIQATGAKETKRLQVRLWDFQPPGVHEWHVIPFNVHDELMAPCKPELKEPIATVVADFVTERRSLIPLLKMDWSQELNTWADK